MNLGGISLAAAVVSAAMGVSAAAAADALPIVATAPPVVVAPAPPVGFDFSGAYVGVMGGAYFAVDPISFGNPRTGVLAGYSFAAGKLVFGVEVGATWQGTPGNFDTTIVGRTGLLLGQRALVYASGGYLRGINGGGAWFTVGGGVELGLGDRISLYAEANYLLPIGFTLQTGVKFHFGN